MSNQRHIIKKQLFDLQVDDESAVPDLQKKVSRLFHEKIVPLIDAYCSALSDARDVHRIDRIEIDLGDIRPDNVEKDFIEKIDVQLSRQLGEKIRIANRLITLTQPEEEEKEKKKKEGTAAELLIYFLQTGRLPWWADYGRKKILEESIAQVIKTDPQQAAAFLKESIRKQTYLTRLIYEFPDEMLLQLTKIYLPQKQDFIASFHEDMTYLLENARIFRSIRPDKKRLEQWRAIFFATEATPGTMPPVPFTKNVLLHLAGKYHIKYIELVKGISKACKTLKKRKPKSELGEAVISINEELKKASRKSQKHKDLVLKELLDELNKSRRFSLADEDRQALLAYFTEISSRQFLSVKAQRQLEALLHVLDSPGQEIRKADLEKITLPVDNREQTTQNDAMLTYQLAKAINVIKSYDADIKEDKERIIDLLQALMRLSANIGNADNKAAFLAYLEQLIAEKPLPKDIQKEADTLLGTLRSVRKTRPETSDESMGYEVALAYQLAETMTAIKSSGVDIEGGKRAVGALLKGLQSLSRNTSLFDEMRLTVLHTLEGLSLDILPAGLRKQLKTFEQVFRNSDRKFVMANLSLFIEQVELLQEVYEKQINEYLKKPKDISRYIPELIREIEKCIPETKDESNQPTQLSRQVELLYQHLFLAREKRDQLMTYLKSLDINELPMLLKKRLMGIIKALQAQHEESEGKGLDWLLDRLRDFKQHKGTSWEQAYERNKGIISQLDVLTKEIEREIRNVEYRIEKERKEVEKGARLEEVNQKFNNSDEVYVLNAGLVLIWPFIKRFLTKIGLVKEDQFVNKEAALRAVLILQLIADDAGELSEYLLPLNKLLCGVDLGEPVATMNFEPTELEQKESEALLKAIIASWPELKNMSADGFQRAYMQRKGVLTPLDGGWSLRVEREPYDVMVDRIPWSINVIKLPWMDYILYVEWGYKD